MNNNEKTELVEAWFDYYFQRVLSSAEIHTYEHEAYWSHEELNDLIDGGGNISHIELAWDLILLIFQQAKKEFDLRLIAYIASGPVEDLLSAHGVDFIDRVETLAKKDAKFAILLGAVWEGDMKDKIWNRVKEVANYSSWNDKE